MLVTLTSSIRYKNSRDQCLTLAPKTDMWLKKCSESANATINGADISGLDGQLYTNSKVNTRNISLTGFCRSQTLLDRITRTFNPTLDGRLTFKDSLRGTKRHIDARPTSIMIGEWSNNQYTFDITLEALQPFWRGVETIGFIQAITNLTTFPLVIQPPFIFGVQRDVYTGLFVNVGDVAIGWVATFYARGNVPNPFIYNIDKSKVMLINYEMQEGDTIVLTNLPTRKMLEINGERAFDRLDIESEFFEFETGDNNITYGADNNVSELELTIKYTPLFLGV